jgi:cytochrome c oxidase subunit 2
MLLKFYNFLLGFGSSLFCDSPYKNQVSFQDPATPVMEGIVLLYDYIWVFLIFIVAFVGWMLARILFIFDEKNNFEIDPTSQHVPLEIVWTLTPALMLSSIGGNSISHLYSSEEMLTPQIDVVVTGNQWFWTYEFMVFLKKVTLESHMIESDSLTLGECRNLEVDNPLVLPINCNIRFLVTSNDVIHSFAVPSLGVKVDAVPGRINSCLVNIDRPGRYYGQCSEICGKGHNSMPIVVLAVLPEEYLAYLHYLNLKSNHLNVFKSLKDNREMHSSDVNLKKKQTLKEIESDFFSLVASSKKKN